MKKNTTDMTVGSPVKHILLFTLPALIGNIFQQVYNLADSMIVGRFVGADALGAEGLKITSTFYLALGLIYVVRGVLNGLGDAFFALFNGIVKVIGRRLLQNFILKKKKGMFS